MIRSVSLPRPDLTDRRTQVALGGAALAAIGLAICVQIGTGNLTLALLLVGLLASPMLVLAAMKWPYIFPYGLYVMLVPFDNMLNIAGSGTLTKLLGMLAVVAIAAHAFLLRRASRPPAALWLWFAFLLWNITGVMWSPDIATAMLFVQTLGSLILLYAVLSVSPVEERDIRAICGFIVLGGVLASLYGIYLLHNAPQMAGDYGRLMINVADRKIDPNHFANSMLTPIALTLVALLGSRKPATIFVNLVALVILGSGVLISLSRETLLGVVAIVAVVVLMSRHRILGLVITVPVLIGVPLLVPQIGQRMAEAFTTGGAGRTNLWRIAWTAFQQRPIVGWGTSGSVDAYDANFFTVFQRSSVGWVITPHNTALHILVELGLIGICLLVVAVAASFLELRAIPADDSLADIRTALVAASVAVCLVSFFIDLENYKYAWLVLITAGQLRCVVRLRGPAVAPYATLEVPVVRTTHRVHAG